MPPRRGWGRGWRGWLQRFRSGRSFRTERGSATRSGFDSSKAFGLFDDVNTRGVLRLTEPRSKRNAVAAFSPSLVGDKPLSRPASREKK